MSAGLLNELFKVIIKHGCEDSIYLRQLHQHFPVSKGQILLWKSIDCGYRSESSPIHEIDAETIYGQSFSAHNGSLVPTEFFSGYINCTLEKAFLTDFMETLIRLDVVDKLGIEIARDDTRGGMFEFSEGFSSTLVYKDSLALVFKDSAALQELDWVVTSWRVTRDGRVWPVTHCQINDKGKHIKVPGPGKSAM